MQGCVLEEYTVGVEEKLRALELESIQDYIAESDNLVDLHQQVIIVCRGALCTVLQRPHGVAISRSTAPFAGAGSEATKKQQGVLVHREDCVGAPYCPVIASIPNCQHV